MSDPTCRTFAGWLLRELFAAIGLASIIVWLFLRHYGAHVCLP